MCVEKFFSDFARFEGITMAAVMIEPAEIFLRFEKFVVSGIVREQRKRDRRRMEIPNLLKQDVLHCRLIFLSSFSSS